jgi:hypothetical protein
MVSMTEARISAPDLLSLFVMTTPRSRPSPSRAPRPRAAPPA